MTFQASVRNAWDDYHTDRFRLPDGSLGDERDVRERVRGLRSALEQRITALPEYIEPALRALADRAMRESYEASRERYAHVIERRTSRSERDAIEARAYERLEEGTFTRDQYRAIIDDLVNERYGHARELLDRK